MCDYCDYPNKEFEIYGASIHACIVNRRPAVPQMVLSVATDQGVLVNSISIRFCPMCGSKLDNAV